MTNPQSLLETIEKTLKEWEVFGRSAQFKAVMPMVDELNKHGVGCPVLAKLLSERSLQTKPATLRQALYRWRVKQTNSSADAPADQQRQVPEESISAGARDLVVTRTADQKEPLTKAKLKEIREQHIDLDEIKRQARRLGENR